MQSGSLVIPATERVRAWVCWTDQSAAELAQRSGLNDKVIRNVRKGRRWNPTTETLQKLEALMPRGWRQTRKRRVA